MVCSCLDSVTSAWTLAIRHLYVLVVVQAQQAGVQLTELGHKLFALKPWT